LATDQDAVVHIAGELGAFIRRTERFWARVPAGPPGRHLDRGALLLLAQLASGGPQRLSGLAGRVGLDLSTVSRQATALEADGLASRQPDPTDRRAFLIDVTQAGHEVLGSSRDRWHAVLRDLLAGWEPTERAEFARLLGRFNDALARREQERER
jgi:DNA-binding MarR family transcriptional regulator